MLRISIQRKEQLELVQDDNCWTPLHCVATRGHVEIVRLLCDRGADVEARSDGDIFAVCTPLHYAVMSGYISIVKELIEERNADMNSRDVAERTALGIAREFGSDLDRDDIIAYLVSRGGEE